MSTPRCSSIVICLAVLLAGVPSLAEPPETSDSKSANQIIDASLDNNALGFQTGAADISLIIEDKAGSRRIRQMDVRSKKVDGDTRTLVELTAPKEVRGQSFLFAENKSHADDVWMYVPAFAVTRRIEGSQKSSSFLGSHFTYADLESRDLEHGHYKRLKDDAIGKMPVYVVQTTPEDVKDSDYGKIVSYIRKSDFMPLKVRFYDKSGDLAKTLFVEKLDKTDNGQSYVERMTLRPKGGGFTTLKINSLDHDAKLADSAFSKDQLGH